jgi:hypothetical protein
VICAAQDAGYRVLDSLLGTLLLAALSILSMFDILAYIQDKLLYSNTFARKGVCVWW